MKYKVLYKHRCFEGIVVIYKISPYSQETVQPIHAEVAFKNGNFTDKVLKLFKKYDLDPIKIRTESTYNDFLVNLYVENSIATEKFLSPKVEEFLKPFFLRDAREITEQLEKIKQST